MIQQPQIRRSKENFCLPKIRVDDESFCLIEVKKGIIGKSFHNAREKVVQPFLNDIELDG